VNTAWNIFPLRESNSRACSLLIVVYSACFFSISGEIGSSGTGIVSGAISGSDSTSIISSSSPFGTSSSSDISIFSGSSSGKGIVSGSNSTSPSSLSSSCSFRP